MKRENAHKIKNGRISDNDRQAMSKMWTIYAAVIIPLLMWTLSEIVIIPL